MDDLRVQSINHHMNEAEGVIGTPVDFEPDDLVNNGQADAMSNSVAVSREDDGVAVKDLGPLPHAEQHSENKFGPLIKPIVYGGCDGLVSVFVGAVIAVVTGQPLAVVLALTLGKLFAGAFSMGAGEFMSTRAEVEYAQGERRREEWECENFKEGEIEEMVELYVGKGYRPETARRIVAILAKDDRLFVNAMMVEELEISLEQEDQSPIKMALVNFTSFLLFGVLPLLPFIVFFIGRSVVCPQVICTSLWNSSLVPLYISIGLTVAGVLLLGVLKAYVTGIKLFVSVGQAFVGALLSVAFGAGLAYAIY